MRSQRMFPLRAGFAAALAFACMSVSPSFAMAEVPEAYPTEKVETVNVSTDASGMVEDVEVETTLKNGNAVDEMRDVSELAEIEGEEDAAYDEVEGGLVWHANGADVTYTGKSTKELPVTIGISYRLNGEEVTAEEIAGKSGDVVIRYDYANASSLPAYVNGSDVEMRIPFTCITAVMLDGETFSDISVTNGKIIDDGSDAIIAGYAMPGLKESLGKLADDSDIPDYLEISARADGFELKSTMTIVTAGLMSDLNADDLGFDDLDDVSSGLDEGMSQLISGADELASGMQSLADGAGKLHEGADELASGAESLSDGLYLLASGEDGKSGLQGAAKSSQKLVEGLEEIDASLAELADSKKGLPALSDGLGALASAYPSAKEVEMLTKAIEASDLDKGSKQALEGLLASTAQVSELSKGLGKCSDGITKLSKGYSEIVKKAGSLPEGLSEAAKAAKKLSDGSSDLSKGADQLNKASSELSNGVRGAADGSDELAQGLVTFDEEGVSEIVSTIDNDIGGLKRRLNILSDAARAYDNFSGKEDGMAGSVKFVYETDAVGAS